MPRRGVKYFLAWEFTLLALVTWVLCGRFYSHSMALPAVTLVCMAITTIVGAASGACLGKKYRQYAGLVIAIVVVVLPFYPVILYFIPQKLPALAVYLWVFIIFVTALPIVALLFVKWVLAKINRLEQGGIRKYDFFDK